MAEADEIDFDINAVPPTWDDGEGLDQTTLTNNVLAQFACDDSLDHKYQQIVEESKPLSDFRKMYYNGDDKYVREQAMRLLKKKIRVDIPNRMKYDKDHKDIVYSNMGVSFALFLHAVASHRLFYIRRTLTSDR